MIKLKLHIITIFILLIWSFSYAQQFSNYSIKNGLPSNHIYTIRQDAKGFLWFLTDQGMVRYNGSEFKNFTTKNGLPKNDIWEAITTPDAKVWYLSKTSKLGYIENDTVVSFSNNTNKIMNPIFTSQVINNVYPTEPIDSYKLVNKQWELTKINNFRTAINCTNHKVYHSLVNYFSINNITKDTIKIYDKSNTLLKQHVLLNPILNNAKRKQLNDSLYVWFSHKKYLVLNLNTLKFTQRNIKDEIDLESSKHLRINVVNNKIQITGTGFVGFLDHQFHIKNVYLFPKEINSHFALIDKNENIWLATFSNGVYKLPKSKKLNKYVLTGSKIKKFNWIDSTLYTSVNGKGFYKFNNYNKDFKLVYQTNNYPYSTVKIDSLKTHLFLSKNEIIKYNNNKFSTLKLTHNINNSYIQDVFNFVYYHKALYGISYFAIVKINPKNYKYEKEIFSSGINKISTFNNRLLIASNQGLKEIKNDSLIDISFKNQSFSNSIISIGNLNSQQVLLGTDGFGAYISDLNTITLLPHSEYLTIEGFFIEKSTLWLATNVGIFSYKKEGNSYIFNRKIDTSDGLPSNNVIDIAIVNNNILASTNNGIVILPKNIKNKSQFLDIYFDNVYYNNTNITYKNKVQKYTSSNTLNFKIASINYSEGNLANSYQYKLEPIQNKWISSSSNNLTFYDLDPKSYKLIVIQEAKEQFFSFKITPLWYQHTTSKLLFIALVFLILGYILLKIRDVELAKKLNKINVQKRLAEYELHALRSQMNPHFVFNSLNSIQYYINKNELELSEKYLIKFSRLIRKFFDFSRDKFITLEQELSLLNNYLEIEKMRFGNDFHYEFKIDEKLQLNKQQIPSMLLQPIVENAVNHGLFHNERKGTIWISFSYNTASKFTIEIKDNGVGLKKAKEIKEQSIKTHTSKSSEILKERIDLLNKSYDWFVTYSIKELVNTNGTCVKLTFSKK